MWDQLAQLAPVALSALVSGLVGWAVGSLREAARGTAERARERAEREAGREREAREERDRTRATLRLLLGYRLTDLHRRYVLGNEPCSPPEKHEAEEVYRLYHDLGGNGGGTQMYREIMAAHVAGRDET